MKSLRSPIIPAVLALLGLWFIWQWFFCRFYVPPGFMAVVISKSGKALPPGHILAQRGQKGIWEEVLGEGRHFLNPVTYEHRIEPCITIPPRKVGVVTSKVGEDLPQGEFVAKRGQKGVWREVLGPGRYRLNPIGYQVDIADAVLIPIGYVGVVTSLAGDNAPNGAFAGPNQKGIRADILQPGLYYVNPKVFKIDVLEVGVNQVSMTGKDGGAAVITKGKISTGNRAMDELQLNVLSNQMQQRADYFANESQGGVLEEGKKMLNKEMSRSASSLGGKWNSEDRRREVQQKPAAPQAAVAAGDFDATKREGDDKSGANSFVLNQFVEFPSRDGFDISLDMTVEFELEPGSIARIFRDYGDLPAVVEKILMPQILSVSRLKGSAYRAVDFIVGEGREKFQVDLTGSLKKSLAERSIAVHNALIRHVNVPGQILDPIQQASIAQEQDLTNKERQNTARKQAELNTEQSLIQQRGAEVAQETAKLKAEIKANQEKKVAEIQAGTLKLAAEIEKQAAEIRAQKVRKLGLANAELTQRIDGERAKGFQMKVQALGDATAYNLAEFAQSLSPQMKINILHAGDGTLWTDLERANLGDLGGAKVLKK